MECLQRHAAMDRRTSASRLAADDYCDELRYELTWIGWLCTHFENHRHFSIASFIYAAAVGVVDQVMCNVLLQWLQQQPLGSVLLCWWCLMMMGHLLFSANTAGTWTLRAYLWMHESDCVCVCMRMCLLRSIVHCIFNWRHQLIAGEMKIADTILLLLFQRTA